MTEQNLRGKELYESEKRQKENTKKKEQRIETFTQAPKKIGRYVLYSFIAIAIIGGLIWLISTRPNLPPTDMQGHIEESPKAHILNAPIPDSIQRHMLEHADGTGKPGVIIQYNCGTYVCESDLVQRLTDLVRQYPDNVYLAQTITTAKSF